jgi:hypothetical protein
MNSIYNFTAKKLDGNLLVLATCFGANCMNELAVKHWAVA